MTAAVTDKPTITVRSCVNGDLITLDHRQFLDRYARNGTFGAAGPTMLVREVFHATPDDWQEEVLLAYGRRERRVSIRSGHGVGKTALLAWIIDHHAVTEMPQKTKVTAPTSTQLFDALWPEVYKWFDKTPPFIRDIFDFKAERIEHKLKPKECFISAATSTAERPEALAGIHEEEGSVLLIGDEASGIPDLIFESASGAMSGHTAMTILAGNPVRTTGFFFETHHAAKDLWHTLHINAEDSPRTDKDFLEQMRRMYGEDSNVYRVRVLGEFPRSDLDAIISYEHIQAAMMRDIRTDPNQPMIWGVDVARSGDDRSVLVKRRSTVVPEYPKVWHFSDAMQLCAVIQAEWDGTPKWDRPIEILVDSIGMGGPVLDRLRQMELPARGINVAESPALKAQYGNLRAELYFKAKEWFARLDCKIPPDQEKRDNGTLGSELAAVGYDFMTKSQKLVAEDKKKVKKKIKRSPDLADAFVLTMAREAVMMLHGSRNAPAANQPLRRRIKGIV